MTIRYLDGESAQFDKQLTELLAYDEEQDQSIEDAVRGIIRDVRHHGDEAVLRYTNQFDGLNAAAIADLEVSHDECQQALETLPAAQRKALEQAAQRIQSYHEHQKAETWSYTEEDGTVLGQKVTPLDRVGLYVPGGKASYPSSVLMNAMPAKVAGVGEIIMTTPTPKGQRNHLVLAAAAVAGVDRVFCIGGAQAIAALAYGTQSIDRTDKIVGPGNAYVAAAKRMVFGAVGIDMVAGPSEILIICDGTTPVSWIVMDLFSQAEHDELAQAILLCPDADYLEAVRAEIAKKLSAMQRHAILEKSISDRAALIKVRDMEHACEIANRIAPEHLEISAQNADKWADQIRHAGAIFLGKYSSEALGDYCAGPNHVLPTSQTARFSSPLGVYDFQKRSSLIEVSQQAARELGMIAAEMAYGEGLQAHALSAEYRFLDKE